MHTKTSESSTTHPKRKSWAASRASPCELSETGPRQQENRPATNNGQRIKRHLFRGSPRALASAAFANTASSACCWTELAAGPPLEASKKRSSALYTSGAAANRQALASFAWSSVYSVSNRTVQGALPSDGPLTRKTFTKGIPCLH